jgi:hypothetical protein
VRLLGRDPDGLGITGIGWTKPAQTGRM